MKRFKWLIILKYVLIVNGVLFLLLTLASFNDIKTFNKNAVHTKGVVTNIVRRGRSMEYSFSPAIRFKDQQGKTFHFVASESSKIPEYQVGTEVDVLYHPFSPEDVVINDFFSIWGLTLMFGYVSTMSLLFGIGGILWTKNKDKKIKKLLNTGKAIDATIQKVQINTRIEFNGRHPCQIYAQWQNPVTQKIHLFKSDNIWFNPMPFIKKDNIQVYINKENPKMYYVDISFLPEMTG